jgi:hypothetical protein
VVDIPESLLRRSAEAKAKALGVPVEDVLAEMKGEGPPVEVPQTPDSTQSTPAEEEVPAADETVAVAPSDAAPLADSGVSLPGAEEGDKEIEEAPSAVAVATPLSEEQSPSEAPAERGQADQGPSEERGDKSEGNGSGNGKVAGLVSPRPVVPPTGVPEGVRTQRLLTVVKARAIQNVKAEPQDKVNTWPHLLLIEFGALLAITGLLVIMAVVIHSPLLDPANLNATPNPSKAPWYFLGLQELLSYFDPQIAGVTVPTIVGMIGFMMIPFVDRNPSTRPSDRKFAILLYSFFIAGSATLTIIGVLFRGKGFNFVYPWKDGIFFDDLKDWVDFE